MQTVLPKLVLVGVALTTPLLAAGSCWTEASARYDIPVALLKAVARAESGFNAKAINVNENGSRDLGLMQINSSHLPTLRKYAITEQRLWDPCTNLNVGAWVLADQFARHGRTWEAVGAYNASCRNRTPAECAKLRQRYAWRVANSMKKNRSTEAHRAPAPVAIQLAVRVTE